MFTDVPKEHSFGTSVTTGPVTERHIPEDLNPKLCSVYVRMATEKEKLAFGIPDILGTVARYHGTHVFKYNVRNAGGRVQVHNLNALASFQND